MSANLRVIAKFLIGLVIFVGLPLQAWGWDDMAGFFSQPARMSYVVVTALLQIVTVIAVPELGNSRGEGKQTVQRQRLAVLFLQLLPLAIVIGAPYGDRRALATLGEAAYIRWVGLVIFVLGFVVMNWAEAQLGKQFSVQVAIQEDHQLITVGLYRYLRHPRYVGIILFNLGFALLFRSWLALLLVCALTGVLLWRIRDEEVLMHQTFGAAWETYARHSWRLVPLVY